MTGGSERPSDKPSLQNQATEINDASTESVELVEQLDFGFFEGNDRYTDWYASRPLLATSDRDQSSEAILSYSPSVRIPTSISPATIVQDDLFVN